MINMLGNNRILDKVATESGTANAITRVYKCSIWRF